jgi:hypothetical protein
MLPAGFRLFSGAFACWVRISFRKNFSEAELRYSLRFRRRFKALAGQAPGCAGNGWVVFNIPPGGVRYADLPGATLFRSYGALIVGSTPIDHRISAAK